MQVLTLYALLDNVPGKEFSLSSLTMEIEGWIDTGLPTSSLQAGAISKQWQETTDTTVTAGKETLNLGLTQRFEVQINIR
jgi:hypothetical protein